MLVAAVPFPTALIGEYLGRDGKTWAMAVYAGLFVAINLSYIWVWACAGFWTYNAFRRNRLRQAS